MCRCSRTPASGSPASELLASGALLSELKLGEVETVRTMLLEGRYESLEEQDERRDGTPLTWAACLGLEDVVEILLTLGAKTETPTAWGSTPLHVACDYGNTSIVKILLSCGADVNAVTSGGDTSCHLAAYRGYTPIVRLLMEYGANPYIKNNLKKNVFHEAQASGKKELITLMKSFTKCSRQSSSHSQKNPESQRVKPDVVEVSRIENPNPEKEHRQMASSSGHNRKHSHTCSHQGTRTHSSKKSHSGNKTQQTDSIPGYKTQEDKISSVEENLDSFVSSQTSKSFYKPKVLPS